MYLESKLGANDQPIRVIMKHMSLLMRIPLLFLVILANIRFSRPFSSPALVGYLFDNNIRFGGIIILIILIIWKKGLLAKILLARPEDKSESDRQKVIQSLTVYFLLIIAMGFCFQFLVPFARFKGQFVLWTYFWDFVVACFFTPISEEIQYRFLALYVLDSFLGRAPAIILSVFLFTLGHNYPLPGMIYITLVGLIATFLTIKYGKLWPAILFHAFINIGGQFELISHYYVFPL